jgi:hypothetical protein
MEYKYSNTYATRIQGLIISIVFSLFIQPCFAQTLGQWTKYIDRLERFGRAIPQEKVYIHLDNTCYFLGDIIWFKAYLRQTSDDTPSKVSGTLYVELINNEGYLVERKLIEMKNGEGDGYFNLPATDAMYAGFYELRAYTRWQLNWGEYEHDFGYNLPFRFGNAYFNKAMRHEAERDYEKLYSRVFPVYNKPIEPGQYDMEMTMHPHQRIYKEKGHKIELNFFPEGGNLIEGVPNRVAFEVTRNGEWINGALNIDGKEIRTINRGRGIFEFVPDSRMQKKLTFMTDSGEVLKPKLPQTDEQGVAIQVIRIGDELQIKTQVVGIPYDSLALTIMHEGKIQYFSPLQQIGDGIQCKDLPSGVNQVTVFDTQGRVYSDRLFFVTKTEDLLPSISISTRERNYSAYERIDVDVRSIRQSTGHLSVSVRDVSRGARNYDSGNILTEMLLASEIRGFVPDPGYYFEADDEDHRQALDLLMMTQGWRRFNWRDMAVKGEWEFVHPAEKTPLLMGSVHKYEAKVKFDPVAGTDPGGSQYKGKDLKDSRLDSLGLSRDMRKRMITDGEVLKREVRVHGLFFNRDFEDYVRGDATTKNGKFCIVLPHFYGVCDFFLSASDTTRWKKKEREGKVPHQWIVDDEEQYPEFYVRLSFPYPNFVKPYTHYQMQEQPLEINDSGWVNAQTDSHFMSEVSVKARRTGLRSYRYAVPVLGFDAYDIFNMGVDAGLIDGWYSSTDDITNTLVTYFIKDISRGNKANVITAYGDVLHGMFEGGDSFFNSSPLEVRKYQYLYNLDSVYLYTDYEPRLEGDSRYWGTENLRIAVLFKLFKDGSIRRTYRDRFLHLQGYATPAEFYSPDYSTRPLPEMVDYRRTLYWNPNLYLDSNGTAHITLYNNCHNSIIEVDAQGQAADGTLLWTK